MAGLSVQLRLADARLQDEARRTQADMAQMYQHCDGESDEEQRRTRKRQSPTPTPDAADADDADNAASLKRPQGYYSHVH